MHLEKDDTVLIGVCVLLFLSLSCIGWRVWGVTALILPLGLALGIVMAGQIESYRRSQIQYRNIQALFSLFSVLKINAPLPPMAGWAIPPDFAVAIVSLIQERRPLRVVELGTGTSTLVTAYALKALGAGTVISLEQKEPFATHSARNVRRHGLQDVATVVYAPLKPVTVRGEPRRWYDTSALDGLHDIDMVIVDGPTRDGRQSLPRYPALPMLIDRLSDRAVLVVDDGRRADVRRMVALWLKEFDGFDCEALESEQGMFILCRQARVAAAESAKA